MQAGTPALPYLFDIVMMLIVGGRERRRDDYAALFRRAGLEPAGMVDGSPETGVCVLEAVRETRVERPDEQP